MTIISVYFCNPLERNFIKKPSAATKETVSLAALLHEMTVTDEHHHSFCIDGSGINNYDIRDLGVIFTFHLEKQVNDIAKKIKQIIGESQDTVTLNIFGFTRGGAAACLLCLQLKTIFPEWLKINVVTADPLGGNLRSTVNFFSTYISKEATLSGQVSDLSGCENVDRMLILYNAKFSDNALIGESAHYPILPLCPDTCKTDIDVFPGLTHSFNKEKKSPIFFIDEEQLITPANNETIIISQRIVEFMLECGTQFDCSKLKLAEDMEVAFYKDDKELLSLYDQMAEKFKLVTHDNRSMQMNNEIIINEQAPYLNRSHQQLAGHEPDDNDSMLYVKTTHTQASLSMEVKRACS